MSIEELKEPVQIAIQAPDFIELHEFYTEMLTAVNVLFITEIRVREASVRPPWTLIRMSGAPDLEVIEQYADVINLIKKVTVESKDKLKV